jgi:hypothetical protein
MKVDTEGSMKRNARQKDSGSQKRLDVDEIDRHVSKALGVAIALSQRGLDEHDRNACDAIADQLIAAQQLLRGEVRHG